MKETTPTRHPSESKVGLRREQTAVAPLLTPLKPAQCSPPFVKPYPDARDSVWTQTMARPNRRRVHPIGVARMIGARTRVGR